MSGVPFLPVGQEKVELALCTTTTTTIGQVKAKQWEEEEVKTGLYYASNPFLRLSLSAFFLPPLKEKRVVGEMQPRLGRGNEQETGEIHLRDRVVARCVSKSPLLYDDPRLCSPLSLWHICLLTLRDLGGASLPILLLATYVYLPTTYTTIGLPNGSGQEATTTCCCLKGNRILLSLRPNLDELVLYT